MGHGPPGFKSVCDITISWTFLYSDRGIRPLRFFETMVTFEATSALTVVSLDAVPVPPSSSFSLSSVEYLFYSSPLFLRCFFLIRGIMPNSFCSFLMLNLACASEPCSQIMKWMDLISISLVLVFKFDPWISASSFLNSSELSSICYGTTQ